MYPARERMVHQQMHVDVANPCTPPDGAIALAQVITVTREDRPVLLVLGDVACGTLGRKESGFHFVPSVQMTLEIGLPSRLQRRRD